MNNAIVTADDLRIIDEAVQALFRAGENTHATKLAVVSLKLRSSSRITDENLPLAEVVDLHGYSRKAPCA